MRKQTDRWAIVLGALIGVPLLCQANEPLAMQSCVGALTKQLSAQSHKTVKVLHAVEERGSGSSSGSLMLPSKPAQLLLTVRNAHNDRILSQVLCSVGARGDVTLAPALIPMP